MHMSLACDKLMLQCCVPAGCSGVEHLTTEGLVGCFADSIGSPVTLEVKRGPSQRLRLRVTPLPAE